MGSCRKLSLWQWAGGATFRKPRDSPHPLLACAQQAAPCWKMHNACSPRMCQVAGCTCRSTTVFSPQAVSPHEGGGGSSGGGGGGTLYVYDASTGMSAPFSTDKQVQRHVTPLSLLSPCVYYKQEVNTSCLRDQSRTRREKTGILLIVWNKRRALLERAHGAPTTRERGCTQKARVLWKRAALTGLGVSARCATSPANSYSPHGSVSAGADGRQVLVALRDFPHGFVELLSIESGSLLLRHSCGFSSSSQRKLLPSPPGG